MDSASSRDRSIGCRAVRTAAQACGKPMANEQDGPVGYKRPPVAHQFKPGVSGNPSGRPKGVRSFKADLLDELAEVIRVRDGDGEVEISKARAIAEVSR